jgi:hypothetical protein
MWSEAPASAAIEKVRVTAEERRETQKKVVLA